MSVVLEKTAEPQVQSCSSLSFHLHRAHACSALLLIDWFACRLTDIQIHGVSNLASGIVPRTRIWLTEQWLEAPSR
jgi:hypothetical protein